MSQSPQSFLLRLWRESETTPLRATLIGVTQLEVRPRHFASLAALFAFLDDLAGEMAGATDELNHPHCTSSETD